MGGWLAVWCAILIASLAVGIIAWQLKELAEERDGSTAAAFAFLAATFFTIVLNAIGWGGIIGWFVYQWATP